MKHEITIRTNPRWRPIRAIITIALQVGVIGIGVATGSTAMQWCGFVLLSLFAIAIVSAISKQNNGISIEEARKRLDEIEEVEDK